MPWNCPLVQQQEMLDRSTQIRPPTCNSFEDGYGRSGDSALRGRRCRLGEDRRARGSASGLPASACTRAHRDAAVAAAQFGVSSDARVLRGAGRWHRWERRHA